MTDNYLLTYHRTDVFNILEDENTAKYFSINVNFLELFENDPNLGNAILKEPEIALEEWNASTIKVQNILLQENNENKFILIKTHVNCRFYSLPICPELHRTLFPNNEDAEKFLQISGTVVRMTETKLLEYQKQYICSKCKYPITAKAEYDKKHIITPPRKCTNPEVCNGTNIISFGEIDSDYCKDYQEIKIQEQITKLGIGSIPHSMWVTLDDDLVDICKPGDSVIICGIVKRRWNIMSIGRKMNIELVIKANHIQVNNTNAAVAVVTAEIKTMFQEFWDRYREQPLLGRDLILKSFCPQIFGLHLVKLAMAIVLAGGCSVVDETNVTGVHVRSEPHLLLVGDPGTGKSHLLRFASKIIPRSVLTTGVGSTAAGLTVTAIMENGEWQLEGGALVMSDGGICCIDEFNSMREHDRTSIHEAMEQQTISVAKASIVCKLSTKCSILAACNPKGNLDRTQPLSMNIALASPLLSRFDLIMLLRDNVNEDWDNLVSDYILNGQNQYSKLTENTIWNIEMLQAYFATIKKINPVLTDDTKLILSSYYQMQRQINNRNKARTTVRLLDSLVRLSQGHARLMYHKEVNVVDAVYAIILMDTAMDADTALLNLNLNVCCSFPKNSTAEYKEIVEIVMKKLHLDDLLEVELQKIGPCGSTASEIQSRFFCNKPGKVNDNVEPVAEVEASSAKVQIDVKRGEDTKKVISEEPNGSKSKKRSITPAKNEISKKKAKKTIKNELQLLNMIPSVNDELSIIDFDESYLNLDSNVSFHNNSVISSTQNKISDNEKEEQNCVNQNDCNLVENEIVIEKLLPQVESVNVTEKQQNVSSKADFFKKFCFKRRNVPVGNVIETNKDCKAVVETNSNETDFKVAVNESSKNSIAIEENKGCKAVKSLFETNYNIEDSDFDL